jgi:hypothetical protein
MSGSAGKRGFGALALLGIAAAALLRRSGSSRSTTSPLYGAFARVSLAIDRAIGWHRLPLILGLPVLIGNRILLRQRNLHDTSTVPSIDQPPPDETAGRRVTARTADGSFNDLGYPTMGRAGTRFGRNVPLEHTYPEPEPAILAPNPRTVSRELLTRHSFVPATTLSLLAASWIQFMVRDWLSHGKGDFENPWRLALSDDDPWGGAGHERPMAIPRTQRDPTRPAGSDGAAPTYINTETHWWDGSQIYGSSKEAQVRVRSGQDGKLVVGPEGSLPAEFLAEAAEQAGWWIGLAMLQTLFTLEHNAICDRLRAEYPSWSDDDLFEHARLVNAALLAKIHTVEWTPAIISHPTTQFALRANWWGIEMERLHRLLGRLTDSEVVSGIPGSPTDHHTAPYAITEEFVAVYRMHPLIPDDFSFRSAATGELLQERSFPEVADRHAAEILERVSMTDLFYSFGIAHPGAIQLHNYPRGLQEFRRPDGNFVDLAATDILRTRELGVPRYNRFRKLLHLRPADSFEALTDNLVWAEELRRVYDDDIDRVDLMVGMFAERKPEGFGFSDTAFRIFILMASRRLKSDRFFTVDYRPAVYTQPGLDWIADNTMSTVLRRHFPGLMPTLRQVDNAFWPWPRVAA